jgi:hypothetical protein
MPSNVHHSRMRVPDQLRAGLTTLGVICFWGVLASASAQSQTTHYQSHSSTHYSTHERTASRVRSVEPKPHSVPSSVVPEVLGKSSARAAVSPNKELNQLEGGSKVKSTGVKSAASPGPAKSTREPEKHNAPINFAHKELPHSRHSGAAKNH